MADEAVVDAKAGFCSNCRRGDHTLCASESCACPDARKHRNRPSFARVDEPASKVQPLRVSPLPDGAEWCDPPARRRRIDYKALAAPCLDRPGAWLRLRTFASASGAFTAAKQVRPALGAGWEVRPAHLDKGSGLWVRWVAS